MDGNLIFCKDSVLRFQSNYSKERVSVPLKNIQSINKNQFFLLSFFRHNILIEKGVTLGNLIIALEPWVELLSSYLDRNVKAYVMASKKEEVVSENVFDWIYINKTQYIFRKFNYEKSEDKGFDVSRFLGRNKIPTKKFNADHVVSASGIKNNDIELYSISTDFSKIRNVPIALSEMEFIQTNIIDKEVSLFDQSLSGVTKTNNGIYIINDTKLNFEELLTAVFVSGLFYFSPEDCEASNKYLKEILNEIDDLEADSAVDEDESIAVADKEMTVSVLPGAFDSVFEHMDQEAKEWSSLLKRLSEEGLIGENKTEMEIEQAPIEMTRGFRVDKEGNFIPIENNEDKKVNKNLH